MFLKGIAVRVEYPYSAPRGGVFNPSARIKLPNPIFLSASEIYLPATQSRTGTYTAMEPRQYRASGMSVSEGRNGGGAKAYPVELAKQQNGRANKISSRDSRDTNLFLPCVLG